MGWNGSGRTQSSSVDANERKNRTRHQQSRRFAVVKVAVGLLLIGSFVAVVFWLLSQKNDCKSEQQVTLLKVVNKAAKNNVSPKPAMTTTNVNRIAKRCDAQQDMSQSPASAVSLPVLPNLPKPPEPIHKNPLPSATDQILSMVVNNDGPVPPIPYTSSLDDDFLNSLKKPIVINDDDPESLKRAKENLIRARDEMKKMLDEGMSAKEVLERCRKDMNIAYATRSGVVKELRELMESGDVEGAEKCRERMNKILEQNGIQSVDLPKTKAERFEEIRQRQLNQKRKVTSLK